MPRYQEKVAGSTDGGALEQLVRFIGERAGDDSPAQDLGAFEKRLHEMMTAVEREVMAEELARHDIDVPEVVVGGVVHRRVARYAKTYFSAAGAVRVERSQYWSDDPAEPSVCPLELRAGVIEGRWTPLAAERAAWVVAHLTPAEGEALFRELGGMQPSRSTLDRLPKELSARWEERREEWEAAVRAGETIPAEATSMSVSLDGVMAPMRDGGRAVKREQAAANGKKGSGPAGYQEVGCGTVSFFDAAGKRLRTVRLGRMPEPKKATLKAFLRREVEHTLGLRPDLTLVKLADGSRDNWTFLGQELPSGVELVDFFHACEYLHDGLEAAHGEGSATARAQFAKWRTVLRDEAGGVERVIRALRYLRDKHPRRKAVRDALRYFRGHRHRMRYAEARARNLPIGSGIVEAACKTLVTQRLKCSGMRWRNPGGQAILTLRSLLQSDRFDPSWALLANSYKQPVLIPGKVVPLHPALAA